MAGQENARGSLAPPLLLKLTLGHVRHIEAGGVERIRLRRLPRGHPLTGAIQPSRQQLFRSWWERGDELGRDVGSWFKTWGCL